MKLVLRRAAVLFPAALLATSFLAGCAILRPSKRIDVGPFSENTMGMVGELQKFNRVVVWTRLNKYKDLPSVAQAQETIYRIRKLLRGIALYSSQVASLYDATMSEERKVSELARYVDETIRPNLPLEVSSDLYVTPGYLDTLVQNIGLRKTLLSALGAAQPLVNMAVSGGDLLVDSLDANVRAFASEINARINEEFGPLVSRIEELDSMQVASVRSYTLLQYHRAGKAAALDSLRSTDPGLREFLPSGRPLAAKDFDAAGRFIVNRTTTIKVLRDQLEPEYSLYRETQAELEALRIQADERARLCRITLILWGRSHRNLAAGIPVPPVIDVMGAMRSTVGTGIKGVLP